MNKFMFIDDEVGMAVLSSNGGALIGGLSMHRFSRGKTTQHKSHKSRKPTSDGDGKKLVECGNREVPYSVDTRKCD